MGARINRLRGTGDAWLLAGDQLEKVPDVGAYVDARCLEAKATRWIIVGGNTVTPVPDLASMHPKAFADCLAILADSVDWAVVCQGLSLSIQVLGFVSADRQRMTGWVRAVEHGFTDATGKRKELAIARYALWSPSTAPFQIVLLDEQVAGEALARATVETASTVLALAASPAAVQFGTDCGAETVSRDLQPVAPMHADTPQSSRWLYRPTESGLRLLRSIPEPFLLLPDHTEHEFAVKVWTRIEQENGFNVPGALSECIHRVDWLYLNNQGHPDCPYSALACRDPELLSSVVDQAHSLTDEILCIF